VGAGRTFYYPLVLQVPATATLTAVLFSGYCLKAFSQLIKGNGKVFLLQAQRVPEVTVPRFRDNGTGWW